MPYPLSGGCRRVRIPPRCRLSHVEPASGAPATNLFLNQSLTIAYRSPEPRARSPPSHSAAPSRTGCATHPGQAARGPDALRDFTLRFAVPRRSPIASAPRDHPSGSRCPAVGRASPGRTESRLGSAPRRTRPADPAPEAFHGCVLLYRCASRSRPAVRSSLTRGHPAAR